MAEALVIELSDGTRVQVAPEGPFTIGRDADLSLDDNPFLHRRFLSLEMSGGVWHLVNVGSQIAATVADEAGRLEAFLAPGASLPLVLDRSRVSFTAGREGYDLVVCNPAASFQPSTFDDSPDSATTRGVARLTPDQRRMLLALAEPRLKREGRSSTLPSNAEAARRLGWTITKFNRKLDNVCDKFDKLGVRGLRGGLGDNASNRRARLVEYAVATRLVTLADLHELDQKSETQSESVPS